MVKLQTLLFLLLVLLAERPQHGTAQRVPADRLRELMGQLENPTKPRRNHAATKVTLAANAMALPEALREIEKQTGNKLVDERATEGARDGGGNLPLTLSVTDEPFWMAIDKLLDAANLAVVPQSGADTLTVTAREAGDGPRVGRAAYSGPFRLEVLEVHAQRDARKSTARSLQLQLEIAWEPRLRPLVVSQAAADLAGTIDAIAPLVPRYPKGVFSSEVPLGTQVVDMTLPFDLPPRPTKKISALQGKLRALVPGRQARFEFGDLANARGKSQRIDDTEVIVDDVRKNNEIWEIHMRLRLDERNPALEAQRSWAFDNRSYLMNGKGESIENAGLETTSEDRHEIGVAYFFDVEGDLAGLKWVYETPAAIAETEVNYELKDIELP